MNKYYVYDEEGFMLRWFYTKAEALHYIGDNQWTIELKKKLGIKDYAAICGECPF
jgi:hypothetical protein